MPSSSAWGPGGTLGCLQAWFAEHSPQTEFVLADPAGSVLADQVETDAIRMPDRGWLRGLAKTLSLRWRTSKG